MNPNDALRKAEEPRIPEPPRPGAHADVHIRTNEVDKAKVSIRTGEGTEPSKGWPKDAEEWKRLLRAAAPWIAGFAVILAAGNAYKRSKCEDEKTDIGYGDLTKRKADRAANRARGTWEDTKENAERGWFGLKRRTEEAADEAAGKVESAKDAAARKARETGAAAKGATRDAQEYVKDKAQDAKESVKETGSWAGQKAHEAADAAKGAYRSAADTTSRAAQKVEERVGAAGSAALAGASAAEEKAGATMKEAGASMQRDGATSKRYWRGEQVKEEQKNKWCSIM